MKKMKMPVTRPRYGHNKLLYKMFENIYYFISKLFVDSFSIKVIKKEIFKPKIAFLHTFSIPFIHVHVFILIL
jgi:hypothetical protein